MKKVAIVGGGVSGMAVAYALQEHGIEKNELVVLEAGNQPGGNLRTDHVDGYTIEQGPNGFLDNSPATFDLINKLGIGDQLLQSNENANKRFIFRAGKLREIQAHPLKFLSSGVLPMGGTLRVCAEPFQKKGGADEESVFDFAARRIGKSAAELLVSSMVQGVFAGDATKLELKSAFPKMYAMEHQYGSLFKAMISKSKDKKKRVGGPAGPGGKLTSFVEGMASLPQALHTALADTVRTQSFVTGIHQVTQDGTSKGRFVLRLRDQSEVEAMSVVLANPAWSASTMLTDLNSDLCTELSKIQYPSVIVVATAFAAADLERVPQGFGFLVPRNQGVRILGCLWSSSVWNHRAPKGCILLRTMVGGSVDPGIASMSQDEVTALVLNELHATMGISATPKFVKVYSHERAIAQYECGHGARMKRIEKHSLCHPGLFLCGSSYGGISVNHCIDEAPRVAQSVAQFLER